MFLSNSLLIFYAQCIAKDKYCSLRKSFIVIIINAGPDINYLPGGFKTINPESQILVCKQRQNYKYRKSDNPLIKDIIHCSTKNFQLLFQYHLLCHGSFLNQFPSFYLHNGIFIVLKWQQSFEVNISVGVLVLTVCRKEMYNCENRKKIRVKKKGKTKTQNLFLKKIHQLKHIHIEKINFV